MMTTEHDWLTSPTATKTATQLTAAQEIEAATAAAMREKAAKISERYKLADRLETEVMSSISGWLDDESLWDDTDYPRMSLEFLKIVALLRQ